MKAGDVAGALSGSGIVLERHFSLDKVQAMAYSYIYE